MKPCVIGADAFGNLDKWQKYATERGHFAAIHRALVYGLANAV